MATLPQHLKLRKSEDGLSWPQTQDQSAQNTAKHAEPSVNPYNQQRSPHAGHLSSDYVQSFIQNSGTSTESLFNDGSNSENEARGSNEDDDSENSVDSRNIKDNDDSQDSEDGQNSKDGQDSEDDQDSEKSEDGEGAGKSEHNEEDKEELQDDGKDDEDDDHNVEMSLVEEDPRLKALLVNEYREMDRYMEENCTNIQMCLDRRISPAELMLAMHKNGAKFTSGLKRARANVSDANEVNENARAKRMKRDGGSDGSSSHGQQNPYDQQPTHNVFGNFQPAFKGEYNRQGALAKTSRRPTTRPPGSAVQRLHSDRSRRHARKATQNKSPDFLYEPQPDIDMGDEAYTIYKNQTDSQSPLYQQQADGLGDGNFYLDVQQPPTGLEPYHFQHANGVGNGHGSPNPAGSQPRTRSHHQRLPGGERFGSVLNVVFQDFADVTTTHVSNSPPSEHNSRNSGSPSEHVKTAHIGAHTAPRRAYRQPTANNVQDDPFFSDELCDGMLDGQPDANHVGRMYTHSQQLEIDEYYQRLMAPHPRTALEGNAQAETMPLPQQSRVEEPQTVFVSDLLNPHSRPQAGQGGGATQPYIRYNLPAASLQSGTAPPIVQVPRRALQPTEELDDGLDVDDITLWGFDWPTFLNDHAV